MDVQVASDTLRVLLAGLLVFFLNAGFESRFARSKNAVNFIKF